MSVYRIDAEYNAENSILAGEDSPDFPSRLLIATSHAFADIRFSRTDYEAVLDTAASAVEEDVPNETELENGRFALKAAPPDEEDEWEIKIEREWNHFRCTLKEETAQKLVDLLRGVHPDHEVDVEDNPDLEAGSA